MQTVDRALRILASFGERRSSWSVTELAKSYEISTSSAQRQLASLASYGFLEQDPETRRYSLGPGVWRIAEIYERTGGLARFATSVLVPLASKTGLSVQFSVPDGSHVRCIAAVDGDEAPRTNHPWVGALYPAFAGATARAYFAFLPGSERYAELKTQPLVRYTAHTPVEIDQILELFDDTLEQGYAYSMNEYNPGSEAIAVPVLLGGRPRASISVVRIGEQHSDRTPMETFLPPLQQTAQIFTERIAQLSPPATTTP